MGAVGVIKMRTYVAEAGGRPALAFRARNDAEAADWPKTNSAQWHLAKRGLSEGDLSTRPATIPERAAWQKGSVRVSESIEKTMSKLDYDPDEPIEEHGPDDYVLDLFGS